jgi:hypothetical protein
MRKKPSILSLIAGALLLVLLVPLGDAAGAAGTAGTVKVAAEGASAPASASKDGKAATARSSQTAQPAKTGKLPEPPKRRLTDGQRDFCHVVRECGLPEPGGYCPPPKELGRPAFEFDSTRCLEARLLNARGVTPTHPIVGYKLYRFLGMEYRVIYTVEDDLPISEARMAYLLGDLPLAARLVSHFRKESYTAQYLDPERKAFKGTKGKRLKGEARLISGTTAEKRLFYFGYGVAEVAWWKLKGPALMDFSYAMPPKGKTLKYRMKILVFPGSGVINTIMNMGMFRKVVLGKIKEVLEDITDSARQLAAGGGAELLESKDWSEEEKRKIEAFLKLP